MDEVVSREKTEKNFENEVFTEGWGHGRKVGGGGAGELSLGKR